MWIPRGRSVEHTSVDCFCHCADSKVTSIDRCYLCLLHCLLLYCYPYLPISSPAHVPTTPAPGTASQHFVVLGEEARCWLRDSQVSLAVVVLLRTG